MTELVKDKSECSGCTACMSVCPKDAITMVKDEKGFLYPKIDKELCVECNLCKSICPIKNYKNDGKVIKVYAVKHKTAEVRMNCASGGAFTAISDYVLENDYIIYGASYDKEFNVCHIKANTKEEVNKLKGSKYSQSNLHNTFNEIRKQLLENKKVLFSGTPCQVAGLKRYLKETNKENLILIDLVCHGVPSNDLWKKYISFVENKYKSNLIKYTSRNKYKSWRGCNVLAEFKNGKKSRGIIANSYQKIFLRNVALRESCFNCKFANMNRISDITIGDFWGIEKLNKNFDDNKGISLMLINTKKGEEIFDKISDDLIYMQKKEEECLQHNLIKPTAKTEEYEDFWKDYDKYEYDILAKKYGGYNLKSFIKVMIKKFLKK